MRLWNKGMCQSKDGWNVKWKVLRRSKFLYQIGQCYSETIDVIQLLAISGLLGMVVNPV